MSPPKPVLAVAFCSDKYMELPLLVAVTSALKHVSENLDVHLYLMLSSIGKQGVARIRKLLDRVGRQYTLTILPPPDAANFQGFRPLQGTLTTYYRLLLPGSIPEVRFLYLDTDTVTATDLSPLALIDMQGYAMGFVVQARMGTALEKDFFLALGNEKNDPAFNSGVMLVDTKQWKAQQCSERLLQFCRRYPQELLAADQTALNALFSRSCFRLDPQFNIRLSTIERNEITGEGVYHFVGSPKPWDIFGSLCHSYSGFWKEQRKAAGVSAWTLNPATQPRAWWRLLRILGSYLRLIRWRLQLIWSEPH